MSKRGPHPLAELARFTSAYFVTDATDEEGALIRCARSEQQRRR